MTTEENQAQALEREIARLLDIANERTRVDAKIEERRKKSSKASRSTCSKTSERTCTSNVEKS
ncbi:hypothetical protein [Pseudomonas sp. S2_E01]